MDSAVAAIPPPQVLRARLVEIQKERRDVKALLRLAERRANEGAYAMSSEGLRVVGIETHGEAAHASR